jgi:hypothetical protein
MKIYTPSATTNAAALASVLLIANAAVAAPILGFNDRGPTEQIAIGAPAAGEASLQSILNDFAPPAGSVIATTDQQAAAAWGSALLPASTVPTMIVEYAGNADINKFGIWFGSDTTNIFKYDLLLGGAFGNVNPVSNDRSQASLGISNGNLKVIGFGCGTEVNCTSAAGVNNALINPSFFGFYIQVGSGATYYSADVLNPNEEARMVAYEVTPTNWFLFFEDGTDFDYNDLGVKIESIRRVPEPASLALLGLALAGAGVVTRRTRK